jgi:DNA modification methylase
MIPPVRTRRRPLNPAATAAIDPVAAAAVESKDPAFTWSQDLSLTVSYRAIDELRPSPRNARTHSDKQIQKLAASIRQFGFVNPLLIDDGGAVVAGHGRLAAAKLLGMTEVPTILLSHLSDEQKRAYRIADNRIAELAGWDEELLAIELKELSDLDLSFEVEITGFEIAEIDALIDPDDGAGSNDPADEGLEPEGPAVTRLGDLWELGPHRLLCADARDSASYEALLNGEKAQLVVTDPPFNVKIDGNVCGKGRHREFVMASGEMSKAEFIGFLRQVFTNLAAASIDGALHYVYMDWRHMQELLAAGHEVYTELKQLCVWAKDNGGMGSFYRSQHELCFVFKNGSAPHINNFGLGETGRYRTNVWRYAGVNSLKRDRQDELAMHPTVKPWAMIGDICKDSSKRAGIILDAFGGSGTTLIAAQKTGRRGYLLELDCLYVDMAIRRWQKLFGKPARNAATGLTFDELAAQRLAGGEACDG